MASESAINCLSRILLGTATAVGSGPRSMSLSYVLTVESSLISLTKSSDSEMVVFNENMLGVKFSRGSTKSSLTNHIYYFHVR